MKNLISITQQVEQDVDLEKMDEVIRLALRSDGEIKEFKQISKNSYEFIGARNSASHGIKGILNINPRKEGGTIINFEGKVVITKWIWMILNIVAFLIILPWALVTVFWAKNSRSKAKTYAEELINKICISL